MMDLIMSSKFGKVTTGEARTIICKHHYRKPNLANIECKCSMVFCVDTAFTISTSIHLWWASTTNKNFLHINGPAKSIWMQSQGCLDHSQGCIGTTGDEGGFS